MSTTRIKQLKAFLLEDPDDTFTRFALALEYLKLEQYDAAENIFTDIVEKHPDYSGVYYHLGKLYETTGRPEQALSTYTEGIDVCRKKREIHAQKELQEAINELAD